MAEDSFPQISLNLDTTPAPFSFTKKKAVNVQLHGNRRSRVKQRNELKRIHASDESAAAAAITDENEGHKKSTESNVSKKKRKRDEGGGGEASYGDSGGNQRFGKHRKTDGIISSLFHKNPEIPQVESSKVDAVSEEVFAGKTFKELPLHPYLVSTLEQKLGFTELTQIQQRAIPILLKRKDALIKSQTGSGKTLAYAVPIIQSIQAFPTRTKRQDGPYALIIVPTRELALQTYNIFIKLLRTFIWIVPGCLMGGEKKKAEKSRLRKGVNILVTTPGRLLDHLNSTNVLSLSRIHWLVIDEADRLLELGYERDVAQILNALNSQCPTHNTVLLSATLSEGVERLSSITLKDPTHISINPGGNDDDDITTATGAGYNLSMEIDGDNDSTGGNGDAAITTMSAQNGFSVPSQLNQFFMVTPCKLRLVTLASWILWKCRYSTPSSKIIVFMSTQDMVEYHWQLFTHILNRNVPDRRLLSSYNANNNATAAQQSYTQYPQQTQTATTTTSSAAGGGAAEGGKRNKGNINTFIKKNVPDLTFYHLHGVMRQKERTETFHKFSKADSGILLCTDVAARGLDMPRVDWIVQYTLPGQTVDYIHRIGRTARAGGQGQSLLFLMPSEVDYVKELNKHNLSLSQMGSTKLLKNLLSHINDFQAKQNAESTRQMPRTHEEAATFLQDRFEEILRKDTDLHKMAGKGFQSYVRAYSTYTKEIKAILKARELHLGHVAKSFGLREAPGQVHGISAKDRAEAKKFRKESKMKGQSRPMTFKQAALSEYSSGFKAIKKKAKAAREW